LDGGEEMSAFDRTVYNLCEEVDYWKSEAEYWKAEYERAQKKASDYLDSSLKSSQECAGNMLRLLLADSDGLVLQKAFGKNALEIERS
jgi:hypothetical protein